MNKTEYNKNHCSYNRRHSYANAQPSVNRDTLHKEKKHTRFEIDNRRSTIYSDNEIVFRDTQTIKNQFELVSSKIKDNEFINRNIVRAGEWLEIDDKNMRVDGERKKIPSHVVAMIAVIAASLMLIVSGAVLRSKATMELYAAENELIQLQSVQAELENELDLKNDLRYIESVARNKLGMIERDHASVYYIETETANKIEIYESGNRESKISALLDALSFLQ